METKDFITLGMSGVALLTTIVWNLHNRRHTDRVAREIRSETFTLDEWKSKRSEVLRTLRELEASFDRLRSLVTGAHQADALDKEVETEGRSLTSAFGALQRELDRIGPVWAEIAYGETQGGETDWDLVHAILDDVRSINDPDAKRARLAAVGVHGRSIAATINRQLTLRTAELDPANC